MENKKPVSKTEFPGIPGQKINRHRIPVPLELDEIDRKILSFLQQNARMTAKEIAEKVFLSSTSITTRIDKLIEKGVISGFTAKINPLSLGYYTKAFINLTLEPIQKKEFYPYIASCPNVIQCNCVTGDYSMLIEVAFHNTLELDYFIGELQKFGSTKTLIVFSTSVEHRESYWVEED
jgi:Lrp/AsnC family transcriptional regulator, leucine-responsive regulatory protein